MNNQDWQTEFLAEIEQANSARAGGNEGRARVCARRAVGIIMGEYIKKNALQDPGPSAYDRIRLMVEQEAIPLSVREKLGHFLLRITPDYELPIEADLIEEAIWLRDALLTED